jgi:hypothetical protein
LIGERFWCAKPHRHPLAVAIGALDVPDTINMPLHKMPAEPSINRQRALEIDNVVRPEETEIRLGKSFAAGLKRPQLAGAFKGDSRQAASVDANALAQSPFGAKIPGNANSEPDRFID